MTEVRQGFTVTTAPTTEPVSVVEVKAQSRIDISDDDTLIARLIKSARTFVETNCRRALIEQTVTIITEAFPARDRLDLHVVAPLLTVTSVKYYDSNGDDQTLDSSTYNVDTVTEPGAIQLVENESWPSTTRRPDAVRIECTAGYGDGADVPEDLRHAILMLTAHYYEHRESVIVGTVANDVPMSVQSLMGPYLRPEFY